MFEQKFTQFFKKIQPIWRRLRYFKVFLYKNCKFIGNFSEALLIQKNSNFIIKVLYVQDTLNLTLSTNCHYFQPAHLEVECESRLHNVPAGTEAHFRVQIVSDKFEGLSQLQVNNFLYFLFKTECLFDQFISQHLTLLNFSANAWSTNCSPKNSRLRFTLYASRPKNRPNLMVRNRLQLQNAVGVMDFKFDRRRPESFFFYLVSSGSS